MTLERTSRVRLVRDLVAGPGPDGSAQGEAENFSVRQAAEDRHA